MKTPIYLTEMLTDARKGLYTQTIYYSDGSVEVRVVPKGPVLFWMLAY